MIVPSRNQDLVALYPYSTYDALYAVGPTQTGKSWGLSHSFVDYVTGHSWPDTGFDGFAVMGPRATQTNMALRNIESAAYDLGVSFVPYSSVRGYAVLDGQKIHRFSIANNYSDSAFRGLTLGGLHVEEATLCNQESLKLAEGRCVVSPAKQFMSTNPDSPFHWFKTERVDRAEELNALYLRFSFDDNPTLSDVRRQALRRTWSGAMLQRMYYGEWVAHAGLVYPNFAQAALVPAPEEQPVSFSLSLDHATATVTHACLWAEYASGHRRVIGEWRHDGRTGGWLGTRDQAERIAKDLVGGLKLRRIYGDPAATHMLAELQAVFGFYNEAFNDVLPGIQQVMLWLDYGQISVDGVRCPWTVREMGGYAWDDKAALRGVPDTPVKENDHAPDAMRYYCYSETQVAERRMARYE